MKPLFLVIISLVPMLFSCDKEQGEPWAYFEYYRSSTFAPAAVSFYDRSINISPGASYHWDFGDSSYSNEKNPRHVYYEAGIFTVKLRIQNSDQKVVSSTSRVGINPVPDHMALNAIDLKSMPFLDENSAPWDPISGPDAFFRITGQTKSLVTLPHTDITKNDLPLKFEFANYARFDIKDMDEPHVIRLFDRDDGSSQQIGPDFNFTPRDWMPTDGSKYPYFIDLKSDSLEIMLHVVWFSS